MMTLTIATVYLLPFGPPAGQGYPNPTLLIEPEDLAKSADRYRVLDVRAKPAYDAGHVPRAVLALSGPWSRAVTEGKADAAFWKRELAAVGVTPDRPVVVVSDDIRNAARAWWLLSLAGVPDVRLLNGGWDAYTAAKLPVGKEPSTAKAPPHDWKPAHGRHATRADAAGLADKQRPGRVIDSRSQAEYDAGHIPGAVRLEWSELIDPQTKKFKPATELAKLLKERNIDPAEESCSY
ncbi:MAG TPA: rhodanese-like domain-containing protein [Gemmataceae bacterium]|jgi:thiosulfate/3-mercaptopyruvate sulfurtransferase|nr:rhodanese-like domain-containing protein [Gemmataceae bacterium]